MNGLPATVSPPAEATTPRQALAGSGPSASRGGKRTRKGLIVCRRAPRRDSLQPACGIAGLRRAGVGAVGLRRNLPSRGGRATAYLAF
ncbi:MAG TPA: hypothetical protein VFS21_40085, partial [Roseiflexaceae bacterium]|nr:hypothetical protein [Roseiflexaceae bacterium]